MRRPARCSALIAAVVFLASLSPDLARARPNILRSDADLGFVLGTGADVFAVSHFPDIGFDVTFGLNTLGTGSGILAAGGIFLPSLHGGLVSGNIAVGATIEGGLIHFNPDFGGDTNVGFLSFIPFVEYAPDGGSIVPFFGFQAGPSVIFPDADDGEVGVLAGGYGGIHVFFGDSFSVSPTAELSFLYAGLVERAAYQIALRLTFRGWIDPSASEAVPEASAPVWEAPTPNRGAGSESESESESDSDSGQEADPETELGDPEAGMD